MSQTHDILTYLKQGNTITQLDALNLFGAFRLSERVREIERLGHAIEHNWLSYYSEKHQKVKRVMSYRLQNPFTEL